MNTLNFLTDVYFQRPILCTTGAAVAGTVFFCGYVARMMMPTKIPKESGKEQQETTVVDGDVMDYWMPHTQEGVGETRFRGIPNGFNWSSVKAAYSLVFELIGNLEMRQVNILNARTRNLEFKECGFTLLPFKEQFEQKDWKETENHKIFQKQAEKIIQEFYPGAEVTMWLDCLFRGGEGENPPAVDGPHLDTYPDWDLVDQETSVEGYSVDATKYRKEEYEAKGWKLVYLGFWKPINMSNPVYDFPLTMIDASTLDVEKNVGRFISEMSHINGKGKLETFRNLGGNFTYHPDQKWYYYPNMTTEEMLVFTHLGPDCSYANVHGSFTHPSAPKDKSSYVSRRSIETRCIMYVPPESL